MKKQCVQGAFTVENVSMSARNTQIYREKTTGFILVDQDLCNGCRSCEAVCPLQVIHFNEAGKMEKCDGCVERIKEGREPACVRTCYPGAITWEKVDG